MPTFLCVLYYNSIDRRSSHLDIGSGKIVANAAESERASFIKRTYVHLAGAIAVFAVLETILFQTGIAFKFAGLLSAAGGFSWLIVMGLFMVVSTVANNWAFYHMLYL